MIATGIAVDLLPQPTSFWVDPSTSLSYTFLNTPLKWGLWSFGPYLGYMALIGLTLSLINRKPAFVLWMGLCVYHFWDITISARCGAVHYFSFENSSNCMAIHSSAILLVGILWGLLLLFSARLGFIPGILPIEETNHAGRKRVNGLRIGSIAWIGVMTLAVMLSAIVPKPAWRLVESTHAPVGRSSAAFSYDTRRSVGVLFGGTDSWTQSTQWHSINDTWEWVGNDWNELHPAHNPSPRFAAGMAYDDKRGVMVLFGGASQDANHENTSLGDLWEWDGVDWLEVSSSSGPSARQSPNMFFDPLRETVVIYGGYNFDKDTQTGNFLDDAWEWDGQTWKSITFDEPKRNSATAIVYDRARQVPILIDGDGLWYWEASRWLQHNFNTSPAGRWGSQLGYDPAKQEVILFGGFKGDDVFDDTWIYDGQTWQQLVPTIKPPKRNNHTLFYDQTRDRMLLFGGINGGTFYNDMWELVRP